MNRRIRRKKAKQLHAHAAEELAQAAVLLAASETVRLAGPIARGLADRVAKRAKARQDAATRDVAVALSLTQRRRHG